MEKLTLISSFPAKAKTHDEYTVGIASYSKNTVRGILSANPGLKVTVLAEKIPEAESTYMDGKIKVKRVWKRGSIFSFPQLLKEGLKSNKKIMIEFEVSMFGGILKTLPFPLFLLILRLFGKNITLVIHQAISDFSQFTGHTNIKGIRSKIISFCLRIFYFLIIGLSQKTVVFEERLKDRLPFKEKIFVIPHGVENFEIKYGKREARKMLGIKENKLVLLIFGYVAWYKGTDWLANAVSKLSKKKEFNNLLLLIAGGPNPNHKDKRFYMRYVEKVKNMPDEEHIFYSGFVPEKMIANYYQASDAVILPYRAFMSASGPLSIAYSFGKPAFVSSQLKETLKTKDIAKEINKLRISESEMTFDLSENDFTRVIRKMLNENFMQQMSSLSKTLKIKRDFKKIGQRYLEVLEK